MASQRSWLASLEGLGNGSLWELQQHLESAFGRDVDPGDHFAELGLAVANAHDRVLAWEETGRQARVATAPRPGPGGEWEWDLDEWRGPIYTRAVAECAARIAQALVIADLIGPGAFAQITWYWPERPTVPDPFAMSGTQASDDPWLGALPSRRAELLEATVLAAASTPVSASPPLMAC